MATQFREWMSRWKQENEGNEFKPYLHSSHDWIKVMHRDDHNKFVTAETAGVETYGGFCKLLEEMATRVK